MKKFITKATLTVMGAQAKVKAILRGNSGENFVESALKILIAVVIGALLLSGLYMLFGDVVMFSSLNSHDRDCYA